MLSAFHALLKTSKNRQAEKAALRVAQDHKKRKALTDGFNAMFTNKVKVSMVKKGRKSVAFTHCTPPTL